MELLIIWFVFSLVMIGPFIIMAVVAALLGTGPVECEDLDLLH